MVQRRLGSTGLAVSPIGLGTAKLGRNTDVKYPAPFELPSDKQVTELLQGALDLGVNLLDTAPAYGDSEHRLGQLIAAQRSRWLLCSKCGETYQNGRSTYDFSAAALSRSVDESLRRLQTDHLDVLLLHSDGRDLEILQHSDAVETLMRMKAAGKTRAVGISAKTPEGIAAAVPVLDVVMAPFSQREAGLKSALAAAQEQGRGTLAIKGLSSGRLEPAAAVEFVLRQPFIDCLILGTINMAHLREAVALADQVHARRPD
jgi:aryl-alcohol dehydrogenase-like predicted oxidoreductase